MLCMKHITIKNGKIDLFNLIPDKTDSGFEVKKEIFIKNSEEWIGVWYIHPRKPKLEIRRFANANIFGKLLGQIQSEGTKPMKKWILEFSNKLISEHKSFVEELEDLGISRNKLNYFLVDSGNLQEEQLKTLAKEFESEIGLLPKIEHHHSMRGGYSYKSLIRNTLLSHLILNAMDLVRKSIPKIYSNEKLLVDSFFAKLLTGDGTIDIGKRKVPRISIKITDQNIDYLYDYAEIMKTLGFKGIDVNSKNIFVKSSCSFDNLLFLYEIEAFKNTINWHKLIVAIGLCLRGRRLKTKKRFIKLFNAEIFTSLDLRKWFNLHPRAARDWIDNMLNFGYFEVIDKESIPHKYKITERAKKLGFLLIEIEKDIQSLTESHNISDLQILLNKLKVRKLNNQPKSAEI